MDSEKNQRNIKLLCQEIRDYRFSDGLGLKLLLAATHPQAGYEKALVESDRLLWAEGSKDNLADSREKITAQATSSTQAKRLGEQSGEPTQRSRYPQISKKSSVLFKKSYKK